MKRRILAFIRKMATEEKKRTRRTFVELEQPRERGNVVKIDPRGLLTMEGRS